MAVQCFFLKMIRYTNCVVMGRKMVERYGFIEAYITFSSKWLSRLGYGL